MPIGIDLGTTTTLVAEAFSDSDGIRSAILRVPQRVWRSETQCEEKDFSYLPSFAYFPTSSEVLVGVEARTLGMIRNELHRCVRAVKRLMGRGLLLPEPINRSPREISALYLEYVLNHLSKQMIYHEGEDMTVTVPASFTSNQRRDTLQALELALKNLGYDLRPEQSRRTLISEPVAALLAYIAEDMQHLTPNINIDKKPLVLVYDMGGGTLDLTLVNLSWKNHIANKSLNNLNFTVRDLSRYNQFAGEDFDLRTAAVLLDKLLEVHPNLRDVELDDESVQALRSRLLEHAERLKRELNDEIAFSGDDSEISFSFSDVFINGAEYSVSDWTVTAADYNRWIASFIVEDGPPADLKNIYRPIEALLERAKLKLEQVDYFLLVGGMARFKLLETALRRRWGSRDGFLVPSAPDEMVARGAAVYSLLKRDDPNFTVIEPSADAYYVAKTSSFDLLLGRGTIEQGEKRQYKLSGEADRLSLQIFAGDPVPPSGEIEEIAASLVYQGGVVIPLKGKYPKNTPVWIRMSYQEQDSSRLPVVDVWVSKEDNHIASIPYSQLISDS